MLVKLLTFLSDVQSGERRLSIRLVSSYVSV